MAVRHRLYRGGRESFFERGILSADNAARVSGASFTRLSERNLRNRARRFAAHSEIYKTRGLRFDRAAARGVPGEYLYGFEPAKLPRIQSNRTLH